MTSNARAGGGPIAIGDTFAMTALPTAAGGTVEIGDGSLIGQPIVLAIEGMLTGRVNAQQTAQALERLQTLGALLFAVVGDAGRAAAVLPPNQAARAIIDRDGVLARTLGLAGGGSAVLDADGRLVAVAPGPSLEPAVAACTRIFHRTARTIARAAAPVLIVHDVIEAELRRRLIAYWEASEEKLVDVVAHATKGLAVRSTEGRKRRADVVISDGDLGAQVRDRLDRRVFPQMRKAFNFTAAEIQDPRVGCYDSANLGWFARHRDVALGVPAADAHPSSYRQFALTINLNSDEYEGGDLWFPEFGRQLYKPDSGAAAVFSTRLLHEALPVVSGRRFGVFIFVFDAANAQLNRRAAAAFAAKVKRSQR